jgi:hypothetical protein
MIHFPLLRTRRLTVQLRELTIGDALALAALPPRREEAACTAFLRCAVESARGLKDPAAWTVQERTLAVAHYLAATAEDGPDFAVGDGRYSDYLDGGAELPTLAPLLELGRAGGDLWHIGHLTGAMAEAIERMAGEVEHVGGRFHWLLGAMAAQLVRAGESAPPAAGPEGGGDAFEQYLLGRARVMAAFPASDFAELMNLYLAGRDKLHHLFRIEFDRDGIVALPKGGAAANLPPARFPVDACIPELARGLVEPPDEPGR